MPNESCDKQDGYDTMKMSTAGFIPGTGAEMTAKFMKGYYQFVELDAGHWLMQFNEPEVSQMIMDHIEKYPMN